MQVVHYLRNGVSVRRKRELLSLLSDDEAELMRCILDLTLYDALKAQNPDLLFQRMLSCTGKFLRELAQLEALQNG